ncbi:hypothetical protein EVAR_3126_1 [Eumeta japonica]|uniref:Histone-lysine N-methyltransferase SETMAR n=1 Tax=Eumeta variegata TaxID=151549 RepID=A0A4C1XIV0_EUMVA|nr:hypothetical protein EVAR_3126_1 [Eumeta japonica]
MTPGFVEIGAVIGSGIGIESETESRIENGASIRIESETGTKIGNGSRVENECGNGIRMKCNWGRSRKRDRARWVPKMLTPFDKQRRLQTSKDFLELVGDNIDEICDRIVTVDETWVRQYDPESKRVHAMDKKRRKAAEEIQGSKVGIEAYDDNFLG